MPTALPLPRTAQPPTPPPSAPSSPPHLSTRSPSAPTIATAPSARAAGAACASAPASPPAQPHTIYEESLHYVRLHPTRRGSAPRPDELDDADATLIHPPFPDHDDDAFHSAPSSSSKPPSPATPSRSDALRRPFSRRSAHDAAAAAAAAAAAVASSSSARPPRGDPKYLSAQRAAKTVRAQREHVVDDDSSVVAADGPDGEEEDDEDDDAATTATAATSASASSRGSSRRSHAKVAARTMSKPLRKSYVGMVAGLASTVGLGQAMFLKATYQSPPDARGPRSGVERARNEKLSSSEGHVARIVTTAQPCDIPANSGSSLATQNAVHAAVDSTVESIRAEVGAMNLAPNVEVRGGETVTTYKRILVIGDSLVSGVGGLSSFEDGPSDGPALPRQVARYLSEMLNADVQWNAVSLTGGDVRMLKRKILPMLIRERERGRMNDISAVVLVTGVNDWKRISPIRTANKFREDLAEFIIEIRRQIGEGCSVFLPAIPGVHHTPRFHEPLRSIVVFLNDYWDSQKLQLSRSMNNVYFVGQPPNEEWGTNPLQFFSTLDRVHPSELGYQRWAERIAEHMVNAFRRRMSGLPGAAPNVVGGGVLPGGYTAASSTVESSTAGADKSEG